MIFNYENIRVQNQGNSLQPFYKSRNTVCQASPHPYSHHSLTREGGCLEAHGQGFRALKLDCTSCAQLVFCCRLCPCVTTASHVIHCFAFGNKVSSSKDKPPSPLLASGRAECIQCVPLLCACFIIDVKEGLYIIDNSSHLLRGVFCSYAATQLFHLMSM